MIYSSHHIDTNLEVKPYRYLVIYERILALGPRFGLVLGPQRHQVRLPGVAIWADFDIFSDSRRAGDI